MGAAEDQDDAEGSEIEDEDQQRGGKDGRGEQGQGDMTEGAPAVSAEDARGGFQARVEV